MRHTYFLLCISNQHYSGLATVYYHLSFAKLFLSLFEIVSHILFYVAHIYFISLPCLQRHTLISSLFPDFRSLHIVACLLMYFFNYVVHVYYKKVLDLALHLITAHPLLYTFLTPLLRYSSTSFSFKFSHVVVYVY